MADEDVAYLADPEYWNSRYSNVYPDEQVHEWFRTFHELEPFLNKYLFQTKPSNLSLKILHLGSGDSTVPEELASRGYQNQLCVDFSEVVVHAMSHKHNHIAGITWSQLDVRQMSTIQTGSIDVAFDKGTMDAMIHGSPWNPPADVVQNTGLYIRELFRVLKGDGVFLYITYRQPHFMKPLFNINGVSWQIKVDILGDAGSFGYYGFILTKAKEPTVG